MAGEAGIAGEGHPSRVTGDSVKSSFRAVDLTGIDVDHPLGCSTGRGNLADHTIPAQCFLFATTIC